MEHSVRQPRALFHLQHFLGDADDVLLVGGTRFASGQPGIGTGDLGIESGIGDGGGIREYTRDHKWRPGGGHNVEDWVVDIADRNPLIDL